MNPRMTLHMKNGARIAIELLPEAAPNTVASLIYVASNGWMDNHAIQRIVPGHWVDLSYTAYGKKGAQYLIPNEFDLHPEIAPLEARPGCVCMGGYGALRNGLKYADTFARVISFSAAIHMFEFEPGDPRRHMVCHEDMVMGDYAAARQTDRNPAVCLEALKARVDAGEGSYPGIYMICGIDDDLIDANRSFRDRLLAAGVPVRYREGPGRHDFAYWNANLPDLLDWMLADEDRA